MFNEHEMIVIVRSRAALVHRATKQSPDDFIIHAWHFLGGGRTDFHDEFAKKRYSKDMYADIQKTEAYLDEDCKMWAAVICP